MTTDSPTPSPIVLIHGLWLTPLSWEYWVERFEGKGHRVLAPAWPGLDKPIDELRRNTAPYERLGINDGDPVTVTSRRGSMTLPAMVVKTIRPDTVFIPYHWPGTQAANQLTNRAVDPLSHMPEFKVAAVRVERAVAS